MKLAAYVVLCYDTCETDERPIPGEPCRDESDTMAASRIADTFRLELRLIRFDARCLVEYADAAAEEKACFRSGHVPFQLLLLAPAHQHGVDVGQALICSIPSDGNIGAGRENAGAHRAAAAIELIGKNPEFEIHLA